MCRFLEHPRIYVFENGGDREVYLSSADLMPRNLNKRVELAVPVLDRGIQGRIVSVLNLGFMDNRQTWRLTKGCRYERVPREVPAVNAQEQLIISPDPLLDSKIVSG